MEDDIQEDLPNHLDVRKLERRRSSLKVTEEDMDYGRDWENDHFFSEGSECAEEIEEQKEDQIDEDIQESIETEDEQDDPETVISDNGTGSDIVESDIEDIDAKHDSDEVFHTNPDQDEQSSVQSVQEGSSPEMAWSEKPVNRKLLAKRESITPSSLSQKDSSGISSQASSYTNGDTEDEPAFEFGAKTKKSARKAKVPGNLKLRSVSPYETALLDSSLKSFMTSQHARELRPKSGAAFSPSKYVAERIASAKLIWQKERKNNLAVLEQQILELTEENRVLNTLVKRQGLALDRLTKQNGDLPNLLFAHNEEIRILRGRMKQAGDFNRNLEEKLKAREIEILRLREATKKLQVQNNLNGRQIVQHPQMPVANSILGSNGSSRRPSRSTSHTNSSMELEEMREQLEDKDRQIAELNHNLHVLKKSSRQQLANEIGRHNAMKKKFNEANETIESLRNVIKDKDRMIHHANIYAHRRNPYRTRSRLHGTLSSASSMISLAPMSEEGSLTPSLKHDKNKTDDKDFNFEDGKTTLVKDYLLAKSLGHVNISDPPPDVAKLKEAVEKEAKVVENWHTLGKKSLFEAKRLRREAEKEKSQTDLNTSKQEDSGKSDDENEEIIDHKQDSDQAGQDLEQDRDPTPDEEVPEQFHDNYGDFFDEDDNEKNDEKYSDATLDKGKQTEKKPVSAKEVIEENIPEPPYETKSLDQPIPDESPDRAESEDDEEEPRTHIIERTNSFNTTKQFFQDKGSVIETKQYEKSKSVTEMSESEKLGLWMPKGMTPTSSNNSSTNNTLKKQEKKEKRYEMRPMYEEKPLDEGKKNQLLATLNALDDTEKSPSGNSTNELYQPSFSKTSSGRSRHGNESTAGLTGFHGLDNPFNASTFNAGNSNSDSSVKSVSSLDADKKAKLMSELFSEKSDYLATKTTLP